MPAGGQRYRGGEPASSEKRLKRCWPIAGPGDALVGRECSGEEGGESAVPEEDRRCARGEPGTARDA